MKINEDDSDGEIIIKNTPAPKKSRGKSERAESDDECSSEEETEESSFLEGGEEPSEGDVEPIVKEGGAD